MDNITEEVRTLKSKLNQLEKAMKTGPKDIVTQFSEFIEVYINHIFKVISFGT